MIDEKTKKKIRENAKDILKFICKMVGVDGICLRVMPRTFVYGKFCIDICGYFIDRRKNKKHNEKHIYQLCCPSYSHTIPSKYYDKIDKNLDSIPGTLPISEFSRHMDIDEDEFTADMAVMICKHLASGRGLSARKAISNIQPEEILINVDLDYGV